MYSVIIYYSHYFKEILDLIEEGGIQTNEANNNEQENDNIIIASIDEQEVNINRQPFLIIDTPVNKKIYNKNNLIKSIFNRKKNKGKRRKCKKTYTEKQRERGRKREKQR